MAVKAQSFGDEVLNHLVNKNIFVNFTVEFLFFIIKLIICIGIYYSVLQLVKRITPIYNKARKKHGIDPSLRSFIKSILYVGLHATLITICLLIIGVKESSLLAFFGTLGIGIGLALKDYLSNFAGGVIVLIFKTYKVGDEVSIADEVGYVYDIDIFATTVRTYSNDLVIVPNGSVVSNKVINYTKTPIRRLKFIVGVPYDADLDVAREALEKLLRTNPLVLTDPPVFSHVDAYADSSINIALKGWATNEHYWTIYNEVLNGIKGALDRENISIPFPQMDVHWNNVDKPKEDK